MSINGTQALGESKIIVPAYIGKGGLEFPQLHMAKHITFLTDERDRPYSAARYQAQEPPALPEFHHAYTVSDELKTAVNDPGQRDKGEWLATFKRERPPKRGEFVPRGYKPITIANKPRLRNKNGLWIVECLKGSTVDLFEPPTGWVIKRYEGAGCYGFPEETMEGKAGEEQARAAFGDDASYWHREEPDRESTEWKPLLRKASGIARGPFYLIAKDTINYAAPYIGFRTCASQEGITEAAIVEYRRRRRAFVTQRDLEELYVLAEKGRAILSEVQRTVSEIMAKNNGRQ